MAISLVDLAAALRLGDGVADPQEPIAGILSRLRRATTEHVNKAASDAPESVKDEACIRMVGYLYDQPTTGRRDSYANAWRNSGAAALLAPWVSHRAAEKSESE